MKKQEWSVKALVAYLKLKLDNDSLIQNIAVVGELSNFNHHHTNHMYFTLKDDKSRISCVMFSSNANKVNFTPENGMKVILQASVSIFEASGTLQLYVKEMLPYGVGDLALKFEHLKQKLSNEGLFKSEYKKPIPKYPMNIAIVSGKDSAALSDIETTLKRRWPIAKTTIYNSLVQGANAHLDLIEKLAIADDTNYDVIILARGGGSIEDLWAFNEELLARQIFKIKTPIISGVGHEIDFTIADFVSDLRAPTPTAAAELATPDIKEVTSYILNTKTSLIDNISTNLNNEMLLIDNYRKSAIFSHPDIITKSYRDDIDTIRNSLNKWKDYQLRKFRQYETISNDFKSKTKKVLHTERIKLNNLESSLDHTIETYKNNAKNNFLRQIELLDSYSPINTLKRGYSIVEKNDKSVNSILDVEVEDSIKIKMVDGNIDAKVVERRLKDE